MRCELVWIENKKKQAKAFDDFWSALKDALILLDEDVQVQGITTGADLLGDPEWVMGSTILNSIWLLMPDDWRE